ncbi:MAG: mfs transporter [Actinomycetota bacterium]|jgi:EmrB/QacA subfamily drug resistance transporter
MSTSAGTSSEVVPKRAGLVLTALILGAIVANLNLSVANVALPDIGRALDASQTEINLIAIGCTLGLAMSVLYLGALGDRYGRKRMLLLGMALTLPASAVSAWAPDGPILIGGRIFTGVAAGLAYPTTLALITALWGPGRARVKAIALWSGIGSGGAVLGPVIAGALLEAFWWGSVFLIAVPPALVAFVLVAKFVPAHVNESTDPVDNLGGILSIFMIATLVLGLSTIAAPGQFLPALAMMGASLVIGALFVIRQRRASNPIYDLHYASRRLFWVAAVSGMIVFGSLMGSLFVGQQFLQNVLAYSTLSAGLAVLPAAFMMMAVSPLSARLINALGSRDTLLIGTSLVVIAFILMLVLWREGTPYWQIGVAYAFVGAGVGIALAPASRALTSSVPVDHVGMASATSDLQRDLGGSIMQALLGSLLTAGYATAMFTQVEASSDASEVNQSTEAILQKSFSSAIALGEQYPQYSAAITEAARQSFLSGANWAYLAAIIAGLAAMVLVRMAYPGKQGENALLNAYTEQDAQESASSKAS